MKYCQKYLHYMIFYARMDFDFAFKRINVINIGGPCEQQRTVIG